ncbi:MAG: aminodeoxychorismate/anthranilate synthase component II [Planctomycetes bacterium]|nr:aminodeoxychorismate/anthranilate synthase component II [Planctomycetota bacterium]
MLLLIDNYDSFVHNLSRYFVELGSDTQVVRNDAITVEKIRLIAPAGIVISPGPCTPHEAGISCELIRELAGSIPILGVCLGHQALAAAFGGQVIRAQEPVHGRTSLIHHTGTGLFEGIPNSFRATRYHSLVVEEATLPKELIVTARTGDGIPMAMAHRDWPVYGVQFHPESVLTQNGRSLLANFLRLAGIACRPTVQEDWIEPVSGIDELPLVAW